MKMKFFSGDSDWKTHGGRWISPKLSNGEFDYWILLDFLNMRELTGEEGNTRYCLRVVAVAPSQVPADHLARAFQSIGHDEIPKDVTDEMKIDALMESGIYAPLKDFDGDNYKRLFRNAHKELPVIEGLFGFYMDKPKNRIGATGWDFIRGNVFPSNQKENA